MTTRLLTGSARRIYRRQPPRGLSMEEFKRRLQPLPLAVVEKARERAIEKEAKRKIRELRFGGAALRRLRVERGVGRPPR